MGFPHNVEDEHFPVEPHLHPASQKAIALLQELVALHKNKAADYGSKEDPFFNYELAAQMLGVPGWQGAAMRLAEKFARLSALVRNGKLTNEGAKELFSDISLISAICWAMFKRGEVEQPQWYKEMTGKCEHCGQGLGEKDVVQT
jgi:hypothetical protein